MALAPFESWEGLWQNTSTTLELPELIRLINRRFRGKTVPTIMTTSTSRPIWKDIDEDTPLPQLIRLMNRRIGTVRIPMTPEALQVVNPTDPIGSETIISAGQIDQTYHIGAITHFQAGAHGNAWIPLIKRYVRRIQATAGGGGGYVRANESLEPRAIADPRYPSPGYRVRARECMCVSATNGWAPGAGAHSATAWWGFGGMPNASGPANNLPFPFVGFRMRYDRSAGGVVTNTLFWRCTVVNDQCVSLYDQVTTVAVDTPHEFQILFDPSTSTVYFYIDGVVKGNYTFVTNTAPGQVTPYVGAGAPTAAGAWNQLWAHFNTGSATFVTEFCYHLSPATPLVTYEYDDT